MDYPEYGTDLQRFLRENIQKRILASFEPKKTVAEVSADWLKSILKDFLNGLELTPRMEVTYVGLKGSVLTVRWIEHVPSPHPVPPIIVFDRRKKP